MKAFIIGTFVAAQLSIAVQPAFAAELGDERGAIASRQGAFAGARLRIPLDGTQARKAQAGLTIAPVTQGRQADGRVTTRFGEGMELRLSGAAKPELAFGGRSLAQLTQGRTGPDGRKLGLSTIGWVAIGVGVAAVTLFVLFESCKDGEICGDDGDG
jgi:hypothetical protein